MKSIKERIKTVKELIREIRADPQAMKELNKWIKKETGLNDKENTNAN